MRSIRLLFRWIYLWHLMLACIGFWSFSTMSTWGSAQGVMYNPEGSPVPAKDVQWAIERAIDAWTSRLDIKSSYLGITGETEKDGYIVVQWESLAQKSLLSQPEEPVGLTAHTSYLGSPVERLGFARWWTRNSDGSDVRVEIVLNPAGVENAKSACFLELLVHEFGHAYGVRGKAGMPGDDKGHSVSPDDVMHAVRGECRPSLSLYDLSMLQKPLKSCHVELTPFGDLEALDYKGQRIRLQAMGKDQWGSPVRSFNYAPSTCNSVVMKDGEFWLNARSFDLGPMILRLRPENGVFTSIPL